MNISITFLSLFLSLSLSVSLCLSLFLSLYLPLYLSLIYLYISISIYPSISLIFVSISISLFLSLSISLLYRFLIDLSTTCNRMALGLHLPVSSFLALTFQVCVYLCSLIALLHSLFLLFCQIFSSSCTICCIINQASHIQEKI